MPPKGKAKAKAKGKHSKDVLTTLALSRNAAHHNQHAGGDITQGNPQLSRAHKTSSGNHQVPRSSFSQFHVRNATTRAELLRK